MSAADTTIRRVDESLARVCRADRWGDAALLAAAVFCVVTVILFGISVAKVYNSRPQQQVGTQWP